MNPANIQNSRFRLSRVRHARISGSGRFSFRRASQAVNGLLMVFNRVSFRNQATAGTPVFASAGKSALVSRPNSNPNNFHLWLMPIKH